MDGVGKRSDLDGRDEMTLTINTSDTKTIRLENELATQALTRMKLLADWIVVENNTVVIAIRMDDVTSYTISKE